MNYGVKPFEHLSELRGFDDRLMKDRLCLYQGYVKNANHLATQLLSMVKLGKTGTAAYTDMKRRFGWEFNGMRLHELYFENLATRPIPLQRDTPLYEKLWREFGQFSTWDGGS